MRKPDFHWVYIVLNYLIIHTSISETQELNISTLFWRSHVSVCQQDEYSHSEEPRRHNPTCCPSLQTLLQFPTVTGGFVTERQYQMSYEAGRHRRTVRNSTPGWTPLTFLVECVDGFNFIIRPRGENVDEAGFFGPSSLEHKQSGRQSKSAVPKR